MSFKSSMVEHVGTISLELNIRGVTGVWGHKFDKFHQRLIQIPRIFHQSPRRTPLARIWKLGMQNKDMADDADIEMMTRVTEIGGTV